MSSAATALAVKCAGDITFHELCRLFDELASTDAKHKDAKLQAFFARYAHLGDMYALLRLMLPKLDSRVYNLGPQKIADVYLKALNMNRESAFKLRNFGSGKSKGAGDFSSVLEEVLTAEAIPGSSTMTASEVNSCLDKLADLSTTRDRIPIIIDLINKLSPGEHKYLCHILCRNSHNLKMGDERILKCFHQDAADWYNFCTSLSEVCTLAIQHPTSRAEKSRLVVGKPFRPQLAARASWDVIESSLQQHPGQWVSQIKFDGERILAHFCESKVTLFSRNQIDMCERYSYGSSLSSVMVNALPGVHDCILDGEILSWNSQLGCFEPFGSIRSAAKNSAKKSSTLCYVVFDIVYLNGSDLLDSPLSDRLQILKETVQVCPHRLEIADSWLVSSAEALAAQLEQAIEVGKHEGLVLKNLAQSYVPNQRSADSWIKVKSDYILDGVLDTFDCVIVGCYLAKSGSRRQGISTFTVAVADESSVVNGKPTRWVPFTKVGTGYSDDELGQIRDDLQPALQPFCSDISYSFLSSWRPPAILKPDFVVDPQKSIVLEVKGFELKPSKRFPTGFNIRFPTVVKIRRDKCCEDCSTVSDIVAFYQAGGRLGSSIFSKISSGKALPKRKKRKRQSALPVCEVPFKLRAVDASDIQAKSQIFSKLTFSIQSDSPLIPRRKLQKLILQHGGRICASVAGFDEDENFFVISGVLTANVKCIIQNAKYNVVKSEWILDSARAKKLQPLFPKYRYILRRETLENLSKIMDEYGILYWEILPHEKLKELLHLAAKKFGEVSRDEMMNLSLNLPPGIWMQMRVPSMLFRDESVYISESCTTRAHSSLSCSCYQLKLIRYDIQMFSGFVQERPNSKTTLFVMCSSRDASNDKHVAMLKQMLQQCECDARNCRIVSIEWIQSSIRRRFIEPIDTKLQFVLCS